MAIEKDISQSTLKCMVDNLLRHIKTHPLDEPKRARVQEAIAATLGYSNWHEAITRIKQKNEPESASEQGYWRIPLDWQSRDITHFFGTTLNGEEFDQSFVRIKQSTLAGHALVHGSEARRRDFLDRLTQLNPKRPILLVQGALALSLRHWKGEKTGMVSSIDLLQRGGLNEIVDALYGYIASTGHDDSMWAARSLSLFTAVLKAWLELRDYGSEPPSWGSIRKYLSSATALQKLTTDNRLTALAQQGLKSYLKSLPQMPSKEEASLEEQHGLVAMHALSALDRLEQSTRTFAAYRGPWAVQQWITIPHQKVPDLETHVVERVDHWVQNHPGGMVVFDGLEADSMVWLSLPRYLAKWSDVGSPMLIGLLQGDVGASFDGMRRRIAYDIDL